MFNGFPSWGPGAGMARTSITPPR